MPEVTLWCKLLISSGISILDEHQGERVLVNLELGDLAGSHWDIFSHMPRSDTSAYTLLEGT